MALTTAFEEALQAVRERTLGLVAPFSYTELERVHHPLMSPLFWDLGHIAAYEDLWLVHRHGGEPLLRGDLADLYDAFETPRAERGEIPFLRGQDVFDYIAAVRERSLQVLARVGPGDGTLFEMVVRHEAQHNETMRQTLFLGGLPGGRPEHEGAPRAAEGWIDVPAGAFEMGAPEHGFAFDNERPRRQVVLPAFRIARRPVTNATWMHFVEGGGYERREWWSSEGWAWKEEYDITHPEGWTADGTAEAGDHPVLHVSWFEADALARSHGARLPTEAEWERAATWDQEPLQDVGEAWEWTSSCFGGYPGFVAHPYREYSEVFFGDAYRVLRGASWATEDRLRSTTFRNWDLPLRRQIFAGVRLAKDVPPMEPSMLEGTVEVHSYLGPGDERTLADDVLDGLTRPLKELQPKHFYDARGSELFDAICELPEYYQTRTERLILETRAEDIVERTGAVELVELGSGSATKTRVLLDAMQAAGTLERYVPVDVSATTVHAAAETLVREYPGMSVYGVVGDFERHLSHLPEPAGPRLVAFLGGTLGNFPPGSRRRFLRGLHNVLGSDGYLLLGTDLVKDPRVIEAAYDDSAGVTAQFNLNVLHVLNRELDANFDVDAFEHVAFFDRKREWIEMRLRATDSQHVRIGKLDLEIDFAAREELRTEISAKFTRERLSGDLEAAGLELVELYTDPDELFAVSLSRRA